MSLTRTTVSVSRRRARSCSACSTKTSSATPFSLCLRTSRICLEVRHSRSRTTHVNINDRVESHVSSRGHREARPAQDARPIVVCAPKVSWLLSRRDAELMSLPSQLCYHRRRLVRRTSVALAKRQETPTIESLWYRGRLERFLSLPLCSRIPFQLRLVVSTSLLWPA